MTECAKALLCAEEGCQLAAAKGYRDCAQASGICDLLAVSERLEPRRELGTGLLGLPVVFGQLASGAPKSGDFVGRVRYGRPASPSFGWFHGLIMRLHLILDKPLSLLYSVATLNKEAQMTHTTETLKATSEILKLVRLIKSHGHDAWLCGDEIHAPHDLSIGVIETYTKDGIGGQKRVILEKPTLQSVRDWLGY